MALNSSGPISLGGSTTGQSINLELNKSATTLVSLNDTDVRTLGGKASGAITIPTDFYGKSTSIWNTATVSGTSNLYGVLRTSGSTWVAVGASGTLGYSSDNAVTWSLTSGYFGATTMRDIIIGGGGWITIGDSGTIYTTTNSGLSWVQRASGVTASLRSIVNTGYWTKTHIIVGYGGTVLTNPGDGADWGSWTKRTIGTTADLNGVAVNNYVTGGSNDSPATVVVAVGDDGIYTSDASGVTWTKRTNGVPTGRAFENVIWVNGQFVVCGYDYILTSTDGINWTVRYNRGTSTPYYGLAANSSFYAVVGIGSLVVTSNDSINWAETNLGTNKDWRAAAAAGLSQSRIVIVGAGGNIKYTS